MHPARSLRRSSFAASLLIVAALLGSSAPVHAQALTFRGRVIDDSTQLPISDATVMVLTEDNKPASVAVRTDSTGTFLLRVGGPGWYRLKGNRLGYREVVTPSFKTLPGLVTVLELAMSPRAHLLAPLSITARYRPNAVAQTDPMADFDYRRRMGGGKYFTAQDIRDRNAFKVTDMLRGLAGVRVSDVQGPATVTMARSLGAMIGTGCTPPVFLDGMKLMMEPMETINTIPVEFITGIEIYKGSSTVPGEFMDGAACGAIVVWTRRGFGAPPPN